MRLALRAVLVLLVIVGSAVGVTAFRLSKGPIPLTFLKSTIERAITDDLGAHAFSIGDITLTSGATGLYLQLDDVAFRQAGATSSLQIPSANVSLAPRALLSGRVAVERIDLVRPRVNLDYAQDGRLAVRITDTVGKSDPTQSSTTGQNRTIKSVDLDTVDIIKALTNVSAGARRNENAGTFLRAVGLRDATVIVDNGRRKTVWNVPELHIDLTHKRSRSNISGTARVASLTGPIAIDFRVLESVTDKTSILEATVSGANPRGLARQLPALASIEALDLPLDGKTRVVFNSDGVLTSASIELSARPGQIYANDLDMPPIAISSGGLVANFDPVRGGLDVSRAFVGGQYGAVEMRGTIRPTATGGPTATHQSPQSPASVDAWAFALDGISGHLGASAPGVPNLPLEALTLRGAINADRGDVALETANLRISGIDIAIQSTKAAPGDPAPSVFEGRIGTIPLTKLLAAWPADVQPHARTWLAKYMTSGTLSGGTIRLRNAQSQPPAAAASAKSTLELSLEAKAIEVVATERLPPLSVPLALIQMNNGKLEISAPDVFIGTGPRRIGIRSTTFTTDFSHSAPESVGDLAFRIAGPLQPVAELLDRDPDKLMRKAGLTVANLDGKIEGQVKLSFPIARNLATTELRTEGRLRITEGRIKNILSTHDVSGAKLDIELSDKAIDVNGELLLAGVPVRLAAQHFINLPPEQQPPVKMTATIDNTDRNKLGLDINDIVDGEVPLDIQTSFDAKGEAQVRVVADLARASLYLDSLAWTKPTGQPGSFSFEPKRVQGGRLELQNVKMSGDTIAAEGSIVIGADNKAKEFSFKEFTLNTISRLEVYGTMSRDNIWDVRAKGIRFDARNMFRDMFNIGSKRNDKPRTKHKTGLDLTATIDTVIGYNETNLRNVNIVMKSRVEGTAEKLMSLDVIALHGSGKPFRAEIRDNPKVGRRFAATSEDAGETLKMVGLYPNAVGGKLGIEVMLDGKAAIERSGELVATGFAVLGDPVVSEVFQNTSAGNTAPRSRTRVVRQQFDFDWMRIPFLVGSGQFVMNDAQIRGPIVGATWRGKVDFTSATMQINGTYVPLQGLNSAVSGIPILGQLLTGVKGEGMFGITFSVAGPSANPEVIVHPLSMIAPGVLRDIFQLGPEKYRINPRLEAAPAARSDAERASSAPPATGGNLDDTAVQRPRKRTLPDWSSETKSLR